MAKHETSKMAATKAPPKSVVAPTVAYKIIATVGHLLVTTFVLASLAVWYYVLPPRKLTEPRHPDAAHSTLWKSSGRRFMGPFWCPAYAPSSAENGQVGRL